MASADEISPQNARCEICGAELGDKVVVQEFADGSLARLCSECAAGVDLTDTPPAARAQPATIWPELPPEASAATEPDPLEKTRELLMPVTDLIALQGEMQGALERLASTLERFALEMITESQGRSAVQSRVQELERELDKTRTQLTETEFLLGAATRSGGFVPAETPPMPTFELPEVPAQTEPTPAAQPALPAATKHAEPSPTTRMEPATAPPPAEQAAPAEYPFVGRRKGERRKASGMDAKISAAEDRRRLPDRRKSQVVPPQAPEAAEEPGRALVPPPTDSGGPPCDTDQATGSAFVPAQVLVAAMGEIAPESQPAFRIEEVQATQRHYNESPFVHRILDVRKSLGRPKANVSRLPGDVPLAFVTILWDIVWYQYLVDLRRNVPLNTERVCLFREGMDLEELAFQFREKNAVVNDDGKLDASELEVRLLSDPDSLITEMVSEETVLMEDITEEHWGTRVAPEFKWDD